MAIRKVTNTFRDGGLGTVLPSSGNVCAVVGNCSAGPYVPTEVAQIDTLLSRFGRGPAVQLGALLLSLPGGGIPIIMQRTPNSVDSTIGVIDDSGLTGTSTVTADGDPVDSFDVVFTVTKGGTVGIPGIKFTVGLDGGKATPRTIALGSALLYDVPDTGLTLHFDNGQTLIEGDVVKFSTTEPTWASDDIVDACTALKTTSRGWGFIALTGAVNASSAGVMNTALLGMEDVIKYRSALMNARGANVGEDDSSWQDVLIGNFGSFSGMRAVVGAGMTRIVSPIDGNNYRRPANWEAALRGVLAPISEDLGRVASGPLAGASIVDEFGNLTEHDELHQPGLDEARFLTLRTYPRKTGVYITSPMTMAPLGSDFSLWQYRRVMDLAAEIAYDELVLHLGDGVRVDLSTGHIDDADAKGIEELVNATLSDRLVSEGHAVKAFVTLSRTDDILNGDLINSTTSVVPLAYINGFNNVLQFQNPALSVVPA